MSKKTKAIELDVHVALWLATYSNDRTVGSYASIIKAWSMWLHRHHIPHLEVTRDHVAAYRDELLVLGRAPGTVSGVISTLSSFYGHLVAEDVLGKNPTVRVAKPVVSSESSRVAPDLSELKRMLEVAELGQDPREHLLVCLLSLNALRISEALSLTLGSLRIIEGRTCVQFIGKGNKPALVRLAEDPTVMALRRVRGAMNDQSGPLFPWSRHQAARMVVDLAQRSDITDKHITCHSLRHAAATIAIDLGLPIHQVQAMMRHSNPQTTSRYYRNKEGAATIVVDSLAGFIAPSASPA